MPIVLTALYRNDSHWSARPCSSTTSPGIRSKARSNHSKHGVTFALAATVLNDPLALSVPDEDHRATEERWLTLGQAANGTLVVVVHTYHEVGVDAARVRIISARRAGKRERRQYESKK